MKPRALVIGAGPAGLGAASQLAGWCARVDVIEARPVDDLRRVGEHVPPAGIAALAGLGLEQLLEDPRHGPSYGVRSAWGAAEFAERDYIFTPQGQGVNLLRPVFDAALAQHARKLGATLHFETRLAGLTRCDAGYVATLRDDTGKRSLHADIVIDASGRHAKAARQLGASITRTDQMIGIMGRVAACDPGLAVGQLLIEAVADGWLYGVTFDGGLGLCAFMTDAPLLQDAQGDALGVWQKRILNSRAFADLFGSACMPSEVTVFDAASQCCDGLTGDDCLAVGDAAAAYDPLSSWGIIKGVLDGFEGGAALEQQTTGQPGALHAHRAKQAADYAAYLDKRSTFYGAENRWQDAPFWRARHVLNAQTTASKRR